MFFGKVNNDFAEIHNLVIADYLLIDRLKKANENLSKNERALCKEVKIH